MRDGSSRPWEKSHSAGTTTGVDSTPLFVVLAGAYWRTGDLAFVRSI
jgi:hypothetical protein